MLNKLLGVLSFVVGLIIVILFPDMRDYQPDAIAFTGVAFGIGLIVLGIYLLKT
ncbi:MAG: hypothetical protein QXG39_02665 [Candidatus Aenigmatarchaeota archaeon]